MRKFDLTRPSVALGVSFVALLVSLGGIAVASIPGRGGVISACYQKHGGALRLINTAKHGAAGNCGTSEKRLEWNQRGVQGIQGVKGAKGDPGPSNAYYAHGLGPSISHLPAGDYVVYGQLVGDNSANINPGSVTGVKVYAGGTGESGQTPISMATFPAGATERGCRNIGAVWRV